MTDWINYYGVLKGRFSIPGVGVRSVMSVGLSGWYSVKGRTAVASVASETEHLEMWSACGEKSQSHMNTCSSRVRFLYGKVSFLCGNTVFYSLMKIFMSNVKLVISTCEKANLTVFLCDTGFLLKYYLSAGTSRASVRTLILHKGLITLDPRREIKSERRRASLIHQLMCLFQICLLTLPGSVQSCISRVKFLMWNFKQWFHSFHPTPSASECPRCEPRLAAVNTALWLCTGNNYPTLFFFSGPEPLPLAASPALSL